MLRAHAFIPAKPQAAVATCIAESFWQRSSSHDSIQIQTNTSRSSATNTSTARRTGTGLRLLTTKGPQSILNTRQGKELYIYVYLIYCCILNVLLCTTCAVKLIEVYCMCC
jgi:hypothetical protein